MLRYVRLRTILRWPWTFSEPSSINLPFLIAISQTLLPSLVTLISRFTLAVHGLYMNVSFPFYDLRNRGFRNWRRYNHCRQSGCVLPGITALIPRGLSTYFAHFEFSGTDVLNQSSCPLNQSTCTTSFVTLKLRKCMVVAFRTGAVLVTGVVVAILTDEGVTKTWFLFLAIPTGSFDRLE